MRVLHLIKGLGLGGAERLLVALAQRRDRSAFEFDVAYLLRAKAALVPVLADAGVKVECLDAGIELDLRWAARLRHRLRHRPVDVVHCHSPYVAGIARLAVRTLAARHRPALVTTEHLPWSGYRVTTRWLNRATFAFDDASFAVSEQVRRSAPARLQGRVEVLVHGVDVAAIRARRVRRESARASLGAEDGEVLIGTIANYRAQKAYPDLLAAARLVADEGIPARFVAVGQGPLEAEVRRRRDELGLAGRFILTGPMEDPAVILAACDVFVLASHYEGYPVAVMEALAMGLPVVATRVGGVPDAVRDGVEGVLVEPGRPDQLAAALCRMATDPILRASCAARSEERGERFDLAPAAGRLAQAYLELTGRSRA
ncbi:MAG: glycosyltransferase [Acidimicrobiales bacterium]